MEVRVLENAELGLYSNLGKLGELQGVEGIGDAEQEESCSISSVSNKT